MVAVVVVVSKGDVPGSCWWWTGPMFIVFVDSSPGFADFSFPFQAFWTQYPSDSAAWVRTARPSIAESICHIIVTLIARLGLGQCTL